MFAFISGFSTIFAPCIWPLLPIILSASTSGGRRKPFGITLGIITSFALLTLTLAYVLQIIPFDPEFSVEVGRSSLFIGTGIPAE